MFRFEWDPNKSKKNKKKNGISFEAAMDVWQSPRLDSASIASSLDGENRSAALGIINGTIYCVIWTSRNRNIRIISARRARNEEKKVYIKSLQDL
jgi:uncharacterized protein